MIRTNKSCTFLSNSGKCKRRLNQKDVNRSNYTRKNNFKIRGFKNTKRSGKHHVYDVILWIDSKGKATAIWFSTILYDF